MSGGASADALLPPSVVEDLVRCLTAAEPERPLPALRSGAAAVSGRALADRVRIVRDALLADLPPGYPAFAAAVRAALAEPGFSGWMTWPVTEAVAVRALDDGTPAAFDDGLALLAELTPRLTAEFGIRSFLAADLDRALVAALSWTGCADEHVRRLASEGTRPRLPWARRVRELLDRPEATIPILDALHRDPSETVRRSVANHLNDVSHSHPALATATAARWLAGPADPRTSRLVRHALRTLVKRGDPEALRLLGFTDATQVVVHGPQLAADVVPSGGELWFDATVENRGPEPATLAIDYVVHFRKADGSLAPKVFKLATRTLGPGGSAAFTRRQSFAPVTTRVHYPGEHAIELQVNGVRHGRATFRLDAERLGG
ncbi:DNA alkylation repair protein [Pseudonocardia aurantiaca]|uniref:DNA alkylation repair protein n=1 Tax=Pseudonocardia aurantiaca TaxID=75290 RepID=A0ABW4FEG7_9PSEU